MPKRNVPLSTKQLILHESGYRCANPICRTILTIEIHHLEQVSEGGSNEAHNLLPLCPNCHSLHHSGHILKESLKTWKMLLLSLNKGFDNKTIDILLMLDLVPSITIMGEGALNIAGLVASGYIELTPPHSGIVAGNISGSRDIRLTSKGRNFIKAWKEGNQSEAINPKSQ